MWVRLARHLGLRSQRTRSGTDVPRLWMPGAERVRGGLPGEMTRIGDDRKVTIHTEGVLRGRHGKDGDARNLAEYVAARNIGYHMVYDYHGRFVQLYTAKEASRALLAGRWSPNRQGTLNIQICFAGVSDASDLRHWPLENWHKFLRWVEAWGVPSQPICNFDNPTRVEANWRRSGWTCHAAAPLNDHVDGRGAPIHRLLSRR